MRRYLLHLLNIRAFTPTEFAKMRIPSPQDIDLWTENHSSRINLEDVDQWCYSFSKTPDHPFNAAARFAFVAHFKATITRTKFLSAFGAKKVLAEDDITKETLKVCLKTGHVAWKKMEAKKEVERTMIAAAQQRARREGRRTTVSSLTKLIAV